MNLDRLNDYFPIEYIEFRPGSAKQDGSSVQALAYIDARHVMDRFDEVCGKDNWQNEFREWKDKSQICGIGIYKEAVYDGASTDRHIVRYGDWVWKWDGADNTDFEGTKGGFTDAFKRAAVLWGVARYLYNIPVIWVAGKQDSKGKTHIADQKEPKQKLLNYLMVPLTGQALTAKNVELLRVALFNEGVDDVNRLIRTVYGGLYSIDNMTDISGKNLVELVRLMKGGPLTDDLIKGIRLATKSGIVYTPAS